MGPVPAVDLHSSSMGLRVKSSPAESFKLGRLSAIVCYSLLQLQGSAQQCRPTTPDALHAAVLRNTQLQAKWRFLFEQEQRVSNVSASTWQPQSTATLTCSFITESYFSWVHEAYAGRGHAAMGSGCGEADGVLSCCCEGQGCREADGARTRCDMGKVRGVGLGTDVLRWG